MMRMPTLVLLLGLAVLAAAEFDFTESFTGFSAKGVSSARDAKATGRLDSNTWRIAMPPFTTQFGDTVTNTFMRSSVSSNPALNTAGIYGLDYAAGMPRGLGILPGPAFGNPGSVEFRIRNGPNEATTMQWSFKWAKAMKSGALTNVEFQYSIPSEGVDWTTLATLAPAFGTVGQFDTRVDSGTEDVLFPKSVFIHFRLLFTPTGVATTTTAFVGVDDIAISANGVMDRDETPARPDDRASQCNPYCDRIPSLRLNDRVNCC